MSYEDNTWTPVVEKMDCPADTAVSGHAVTKWRMTMPDGQTHDWWSKDVSGSVAAMAAALWALSRLL